MELRDDVIVVRQWRAEDADAVYEACQDLDMLQWLPRIPRPYTREDARAFVAGETGLGPHQYGIEKDGRVVGSIGMLINENETGHIGYWCLRSERGQGIVPRAVRLLARGRSALAPAPPRRPPPGLGDVLAAAGRALSEQAGAYSREA